MAEKNIVQDTRNSNAWPSHIHFLLVWCDNDPSVLVESFWISCSVESRLSAVEERSRNTCGNFSSSARTGWYLKFMVELFWERIYSRRKKTTSCLTISNWDGENESISRDFFWELGWAKVKMGLDGREKVVWLMIQSTIFTKTLSPETNSCCRQMLHAIGVVSDLIWFPCAGAYILKPNCRLI